MAYHTFVDEAGALANVQPFTSGGAAAVNTGAAAIELKAAVTSKRHWVRWWLVTNITAGQYPVAVLQDGNASAVLHAHMTTQESWVTSGRTVMQYFDPPLEIASGEAIDYALQTATGDCHSAVGGWVEQ